MSFDTEFPEVLKPEIELRAWCSDKNIVIENHQLLDFDEAGNIVNCEVFQTATQRKTGKLGSENSLSRAIAKHLAHELQTEAMLDAISTGNIQNHELALINLSDEEIRTLTKEQAQEAFTQKKETVGAKLIARRMRRQRNRAIETIALHSKIVGGNRAIRTRCTQFAHNTKIKSIEATRNFINNHKIIGADGQEFSMSEAGVTAKKRLAELFSMCKGIEKVAETDGLEWARVIVTVPGHMHPNPKNGGNWDGTTPRESANWIQKKWELLRARLEKHDIKISGLWTRESHADACTHINFLLYFNGEHKQEIEELFTEIFGHSKNAINFEIGDSRAKFSTYALKYFTKFFKENPDDDALDEAAWATTWGLRRHGFFGIPTLSSYRRLRAQHTTPIINDTLLKSCWRAARGGRADVWISLNGGLSVKNSTRPVKAVYKKHINSRICVGIENIGTGAQIINKIPGFYSLQKCSTSPENAGVILVLSYPRVSDSDMQEKEKRAYLIASRGSG